MVDSTAAYERGPDSPSVSLVTGDRATSERSIRPPAPGSEGIDGAGAEHASALLQMGAVKQDAGAYLEAEDLFRRALEIGERALGVENPALVPAITSLASALILAGRFDEARPLVQRALAVSETGAAKNDPDLAIVLNELARLCLKQSAFELAEPLLLRMFALKRTKGEDHPEVATVLASLATVRQALGRHESAEQLWRRVLEIRERTLAPNHFALATALEHLGEACAARGKTGEALQLLQRAQTIRELTLGAGHQSVRICRDRIADLQLQAEGSLDSEVLAPAPAPERYRLLSADTSQASTPPVTRERTTPAPRKGTARLIENDPPARSIERELPQPVTAAAVPTLSVPEVAVPLAKAAEPAAGAAPASPVNYRDVIMSIRQELEEDDETAVATPRAAAIIASAVAAVKQRQKATVVGIVGIAALVTLASVSRAWSESAAFEAGASAEPSRAISTPVIPTAASTSPAKDSENPPAVAAAPATPVSRDRADQRATAKKPTERKASEGAPISIPKISATLAGNFDSVVRARTSLSRSVTEAGATQPLSLTGSGQPLTFAREDVASAPQRARLIGVLPTPRYPAQLNGVEGEVRVRFQVDSLGRPVTSSISVVRSSNALFTAATLKVIPELRFEPARAGGSESKPVSDVVQVGFQFKPSK
jgi:TonB family protein